jgi:hypothetical protein
MISVNRTHQGLCRVYCAPHMISANTTHQGLCRTSGGQSPTSHRGCYNSMPGHFLWDLW